MSLSYSDFDCYGVLEVESGEEIENYAIVYYHTAVNHNKSS